MTFEENVMKKKKAITSSACLNHRLHKVAKHFTTFIGISIHVYTSNKI